jgi:hypothetical protein
MNRQFALRSSSLRGKSGNMKNFNQRDFLWILPLPLNQVCKKSCAYPFAWNTNDEW